MKKSKRKTTLCGSSGKKSRMIIARDKKLVSPCLTREYSFVYKKSRGCYIWNADGKKFLDFTSGVAVMNSGHTNPDVVRAIKKQLDYGLHCGFADFYAELPLDFIEKALSFMHKSLNQAFLSNSGTESVEAAYKMARWHSKKKWTIAFSPSFHGRTMGSLSLTDAKPVHKDRYDPFLLVRHSPYPYCYRCAFKKSPSNCSLECLDTLEKTIRACNCDLASIFIEPIAGEPGYIVPPKEFMKGLRKLCDDYHVLLCADEVQSGCFRSGTFLAIDNFKIIPDIVSLSKALGGGLPIGLTVANRKIQDWIPGSHANTFGGNLIACASGLANLKFMEKNKLGENAKKIGSYMMKRLQEMQVKFDLIGDVRGKGLMIGVELVTDQKTKKHAIKERHKVLCEALKNKLLLLPAGISTIRFAPPLILSKEDADKGLDIFEKSLKNVRY